MNDEDASPLTQRRQTTPGRNRNSDGDPDTPTEPLPQAFDGSLEIDGPIPPPGQQEPLKEKSRPAGASLGDAKVRLLLGLNVGALNRAWKPRRYTTGFDEIGKSPPPRR